MRIDKNLIKVSGIYYIIVTTPDKVYDYVGSSVNMYQRLHQHKSKLSKDKHGNPILQNLYNKYGETCFTFNVLESNIDKNNLALKEQHYIDTLKPYINITKEVIRNTPAPETSLKIAETLKRRRANGEIEHSGSPMKEVEVYKNGILIDTCCSIEETSRKYGVPHSKISLICHKKQSRLSAKHLQFCFTGEGIIDISNNTSSLSKHIVTVIEDESGNKVEFTRLADIIVFFRNNIYQNLNNKYTICSVSKIG